MCLNAAKTLYLLMTTALDLLCGVFCLNPKLMLRVFAEQKEVVVVLLCNHQNHNFNTDVCGLSRPKKGIEAKPGAQLTKRENVMHHAGGAVHKSHLSLRKKHSLF